MVKLALKTSEPIDVAASVKLHSKQSAQQTTSANPAFVAPQKDPSETM